MEPWSDIAAQISASTGIPFSVQKVGKIGGGCISQGHRIESSNQYFFVKINSSDNFSMFEAEASGLQEICNSRTLRIPIPVCWGRNESSSWLVMEFLERGSAGREGAESLGRGLASMHRFSSEKFGWVRDNTIGTTPQFNRLSSNWIQFWRDQRLGYQLQLAKANGYTGKLQPLGERLMAELDAFFMDTLTVPSLLHGDLWSGNYTFDSAGQPVLFDPAIYYGDREADLAMTELFGGFPTNFYAAYRETYPLDPGYVIRKDLYNLYHILNHLNLFGEGYLNQAEEMMEKLHSEIR
jgi:fructosamine-3-kinase